MQRDTAVAVVLALLALLAIGAAGATLENPADADAGSGLGSGGDGGIGASSGGDASRNSNGSDGGTSQWTREVSGACMSILQTLTAKLLIAGSVVVLAGYIWWRTSSPWMGVVTVILYGPIVFTIWFALAGCQTLQEGVMPSQPANRTGPSDASGGGGSLGAAAETATSQPSVLLAVVLVVLIVAAVILLYVASADDLVDSQLDREAPEDDHEETDIAAVGRLAGEAADRIEMGDEFGNEVYRAWTEMTTHLAVEHPESSTPAEFAAAAVDAGMAPDDVRELTDLFEEVRYGNREVTEERERRAAAALRRIEESYAEGEE